MSSISEMKFWSARSNRNYSVHATAVSLCVCLCSWWWRAVRAVAACRTRFGANDWRRLERECNIYAADASQSSSSSSVSFQPSSTHSWPNEESCAESRLTYISGSNTVRVPVCVSVRALARMLRVVCMCVMWCNVYIVLNNCKRRVDVDVKLSDRNSKRTTTTLDDCAES